MHLGDEIGRSCGTRAGIEDLQVQIAGLSGVDGGSELAAAIESGGDRRAVHQNIAPLMKSLPWRVTVVEPTLNDIGLAELRMGMGFRTEMLWLIETLGSSTLTTGELHNVARCGHNRRRGIGERSVRVGDDGAYL